jgi:predicted flap endonuclease-1-like 5' DNA nuclease
MNFGFIIFFQANRSINFGKNSSVKCIKQIARGVEVPVKRGIAVWISGFLTFLAALNSLGAVIYWISRGRNSVVTPYLIDEYTGKLRTETYFWISIITTFIFLGLTCIIAYRRLPPDPEIVKMFVKVGGNLAALRKIQEATTMELSEKVENNRTTNEQLFKKAETNLENVKKETLDTLEKQEKAVQKVRRDMISTVETKVNETREEMLGMLEKQGTTIRKVELLSKLGAEDIKKQRTELEDIRNRLEKMEGQMMPPQPRLKSQDDTEEIRGIGPRLKEELKSIGITNVGELIMSDSATIDEKTRVSREMAERLQAIAQLLMIPGVDENAAELLHEAGVTSRRELAAQDLVPLSRKIGEIAKTHIEEKKMSEDEKPTIEEISSWIRMAKS